MARRAAVVPCRHKHGPAVVAWEERGGGVGAPGAGALRARRGVAPAGPQEADKFAREAAARAQGRASAPGRESAIIAYLEKLSGETITLPPPANPAPYADDTCHDAGIGKELIAYEGGYGIVDAAPDGSGALHFGSSRWPKHEVVVAYEVEALHFGSSWLIRVRWEQETRFQEPGLKGPLWEQETPRRRAWSCSTVDAVVK